MTKRKKSEEHEPSDAELLLGFSEGPQKRKRVGSNRIARKPMSTPMFKTTEWEPIKPQKISFSTYAQILGSHATGIEQVFEKMREYLKELKGAKKPKDYVLQTGTGTKDQRFIDRMKKLLSTNEDSKHPGMAGRFLIRLKKAKSANENASVLISTFVNFVLDLLQTLKKGGYWHMRLNPGNKTMKENQYLPYAQRIIELAQTAALEADIELPLQMFLSEIDPRSEAAAETIQRVARGNSGRRRSKRQKAARTIQKVVRGSNSRRKNGKKGGKKSA